MPVPVQSPPDFSKHLPDKISQIYASYPPLKFLFRCPLPIFHCLLYLLQSLSHLPFCIVTKIGYEHDKHIFVAPYAAIFNCQKYIVPALPYHLKMFFSSSSSMSLSSILSAVSPTRAVSLPDRLPSLFASMSINSSASCFCASVSFILRSE